MVSYKIEYNTYITKNKGKFEIHNKIYYKLKSIDKVVV